MLGAEFPANLLGLCEQVSACRMALTASVSSPVNGEGCWRPARAA